MTLINRLIIRTAVYRRISNKLIGKLLEYIHWGLRISKVKADQYNDKISRQDSSGLVDNEVQIMHQGIKVKKDAYCGPYMTKLISQNKGVHEPEEEYYFGKYLKEISNFKGMIELGSYWAYYSAWYLKQSSQTEKAKCLCIDMHDYNVNVGKKTMELNSLNGKSKFLKGKIAASVNTSTNEFTVDYLVEKYFPNGINILHSDIQGHEYHMLSGSEKSMYNKLIDCFFISTHSNEIHENCKRKLMDHNYEIVADINLEKSSSFDGLVMAKLK